MKDEEKRREESRQSEAANENRPPEIPPLNTSRGKVIGTALMGLAGLLMMVLGLLYLALILKCK